MIVDPGAGHPNEASLRQFYEAAAQEIMALPGVRGVAWATTLPLGRSYQGSSFFEIVGDPPLAESQRPAADYQIVSPAYFTTVDLPIVTGRRFDERNVPGKVQVCIVNEAFVRRYLQGLSPIGTALGANPGHVLAPILSRTMVLMGSGVTAGGVLLLLFVAVNRPTTDVALYAGYFAVTSVIRFAACLLACIGPAKRAFRINPADALREA